MVQEDILINWAPHETRVAVVENGILQELHLERALERGLIGNVYLGKIARVLPGMQSAFVDIGLDKSAFLHVADLWHKPAEGETISAARAQSTAIPIEKQVFEGQSVLVQVIKDPIGSKGARLSTQISIAGRLLVFLPQDDHIGVSQKIDPERREALRQRVQGLSRGLGGGFILRTNAEDASDEDLSEDIVYLRRVWEQIRKNARVHRAPSLLHQDLTLMQRVLRDLVRTGTGKIWIDSAEQFNALSVFGQIYMPGVSQRLQHYLGDRPLFDLHGIEGEIAKALGRRVDLKSGGYLMIDQTEAMTTVDVNTGGFVGLRNFDDTIFKTNLEATQAIARQLRLRNLGGIIMVDFIDMMRDDHKQAVLAEMRKQLALDPVKTTCSEYSPLGLLALTRKRTRDSLAHQLCEHCPSCQGTGILKTARSVCYDILREIVREARQFNPREFRVVASPAVIDMLIDEESAYLSALTSFIGKPVSLHSESAKGQEQYDIILL